MIEIKVFNWVTEKYEWLDMRPNEIIELKYEANPIGDLEKRNSDNTNIFKIPRTQNNARILDYPQHTFGIARPAYKRTPCSVYSEGIEIFGNGSYLVLVSINTKEFSIRIFSGIANFFSTLNEHKLRELPSKPEEGKYHIPNVDWSVQGTIDSNKQESDVLIPIIDWNMEDYPDSTILIDSNDENIPEVKANTLYPAVKLKKLMETICESHGYSLKTDVENDPLYRNSAVLCVSGSPSEAPKSTWDGEFNLLQAPIRIDSEGFLPIETIINAGAGEISGNFTAHNQLLKITFPENGTFRIFVNMEFQPADQPEIVFVNGDLLFYIDGIEEPLRLTQSYTGIVVIEGEKGEELSIALKNPTFGTITRITEFNVRIAEFITSTDDSFPNHNFSVVRNLPDISQKEVFKQFLLMFGQMVYVDEKKKIVHCYNWNAVFNNRYQKDENGKPVLLGGKPIPLFDWSNKTDIRNQEQTYSYGSYGQKSVIKYTDYKYTDELENEKKLISTGYFKVPNELLEDEKTVAELTLKAVDEFPRFDWGYMAKIRYRKNGVSQNDAPFAIVYLNKRGDGSENVIKLNEQAGMITHSGFAKKVFYGTFKDVEAQQLVNKYYHLLQNSIMRRCRVYTIFFKLNPTDIINFSHSYPIFIKNNFSQFFFINKLSYREGTLAKAEIVAMYPDIEPE